MEETLTGGICIGDIDGDNKDDIYYPRLDGADVLLLNRHGKQLIDVSDISNVNSITDKIHSNGCQFVDIDNDGDNDIYITTVGDERFYLLVNSDGMGTFKEEAKERGLANLKINNRLTAGFSIAVSDYNVDGWLDIVTTEWMPMLERKGKLKRTAWHDLVDKKDATNSRIFKNIGAEKPGYFVDATEESTIMSRIPRGTGRDFLNDVDENPRASLCSGISPNDLKEVLKILEVNITGIGASVRKFKNLRDGDSLWYEFKESKEVVDVLSELSLLGFLRKVTGVRSLKVEFNYNEE